MTNYPLAKNLHCWASQWELLWTNKNSNIWQEILKTVLAINSWEISISCRSRIFLNTAAPKEASATLNLKNLELGQGGQTKSFLQRGFCLKTIEMIRLRIHHLLLRMIFRMGCWVCWTEESFHVMSISLLLLREVTDHFSTSKSHSGRKLKKNHLNGNTKYNPCRGTIESLQQVRAKAMPRI